MTSKTFVDKETIIDADWLNDVDRLAYGPATKTIAKTLTPVDGAKIYPQGTDGGVFIGGTNVVGYYNDDGTNGSYGTKFKPTGGDGSAGWERPEPNPILPKWFKVIADGDPVAKTGTDNTVAWKAIFAQVLVSEYAIDYEGFSVITDVLEYDIDPLGAGNKQGLKLIGSGQDTAGFINKITAGGPTIRLTAGALPPFQFNGEISGLTFVESGSGANSHGIEYRGCWFQKFLDLTFTDLTGAGIQGVNTEDDFDSSAWVEMNNINASSCLGGGYNSGPCTGGLSHHTLTSYRFFNCGGSDGNLIIDGCIHFKAVDMGLFGVPTAADYVATQIGVHIKGTNIFPQRITVVDGEMGNSLQRGLVIDKLIGGEIGGFRIVKRPGEATLTTGIEIGDGSTVDGLTINPINVDWNDAIPVSTLYKIGTSISNNFTLKSPRIAAFAAGNIYLTFNAGAENKGGEIKDRFGNLLLQRTVLRNRQTLTAPGNLNIDLLTGNLQQFLMSGAGATGAYTIVAPINGAVDGGSFKIQIWNSTGGVITVAFPATMNNGGFVAPTTGQITSATYIFDASSAKWRADGAWSTPHTA